MGGLAWATTFTLAGYGFATSFKSAGETATRISLGAAVLMGVALLLPPPTDQGGEMGTRSRSPSRPTP